VCEAIAKQRLLDQHGGSLEAASRFKSYSWKERLYIEEDAPVWFDMPTCRQSGIHVSQVRISSYISSFAFPLPLCSPPAPLPSLADPHPPPRRRRQARANKPASVKLMDMGPKLLLSDRSTADQPLLRWRLRVTGNTALELGVVPACLEVSNNSLHKADSVKGSRTLRCTGFSSQITAGSHLPLKIPVVRGTIVDLVASRGLVQIILFYPADAQEIKWNREGHPVPAPYQGPRVLRFELEFSESYDVKLAATCWAKASFEVLHAKRNCDGEVHTGTPAAAVHAGAPQAVIETTMEAIPATGAERSSSAEFAPMDVDEDVGGGNEPPSRKHGGLEGARCSDVCNALSDDSSQSLG